MQNHAHLPYQLRRSDPRWSVCYLLNTGTPLVSSPVWSVWCCSLSLSLFLLVCFSLFLCMFSDTPQHCPDMSMDRLYIFGDEPLEPLPDILILWFGSFPNQCLSVSMNEVAARWISGMSNLSAWELLWFSQHGESIDPRMAAVETNVKMATEGVEVTALKCPFLPAFITAGWGCCTFRGLWSVGGTTFGRLD